MNTIKTKIFKFNFLFPGAVFFTSLGLRIIPVSRPLQWYWRPLLFWRALRYGELENTFQTGHPGVLNMWLSGAAATLYKMFKGFPETTGVGKAFDWNAKVPQEAIFWTHLPLAIYVALGIVIAYFLIKRLFGQKVAVFSTILLVLEPIFVAQSQVLHLDAVTAITIVLSALGILVFLNERKNWQLFLASIFCGLALLNRTSSIFLIPFACLAFLVDELHKRRNKIENTKPIDKLLLIFFSPLGVRLTKRLFIFSFIAIAIFIILYPAMWVVPKEVLSEIWRGGFEAPITTIHPRQKYFLGQVGILNFGSAYYLWSIALFTAPLTLVSSLGSFLNLNKDKADKQKNIILIWAFELFFFIMVVLVAKQGSRYLLPFFVMLPVLAGIGLAKVYNFLLQRFGKKSQGIIIFILTLLFSTQAVTIIAKHPYFGLYFNPLFGGHKKASYVFSLQEQGEGYTEASKYINSLENTTNLKVACTTPAVCQQLLNTQVLLIQDYKQADYLLFDRNKVMRQDAGEAWEIYKNKTPLKIISFDKIPYVWIFEK